MSSNEEEVFEQVEEQIDADSEDGESSSKTERTRHVWKPDLEDLDNMIAGDGTLLVDEGEFIVIQYPEQWRSSAIWKVLNIRENGDMILIEPGRPYHGMTNWKTGPGYGLIFKIYDPKVKLSARKTSYKIEVK